MEEHIRKQCCFIGHRKIDNSFELRNKLSEEIKKMINTGIDTFLFGSNSEFNTLCYNIVSELKQKYPHIRRIYVRAEYPDINDDYAEYLLGKYEDTYYPDKIRNAGRLIYVERNQIMIDQCFVCVFYYKEEYLPPKRHASKKDIFDHQPKSGTKIAYDYAVKNHKKIINVLS